MSQDLDSADQLAEAVRAVLAAAQTVRQRLRSDRSDHDMAILADLAERLDALDAALADTGPRVMPDTPWREVLAGDEAYSPKTDRWYPVANTRSASNLSGTSTLVWLDIDGERRRYDKNGDETVTIRRPAGPEADAVAVLRAAGFDVATLASAS
jgi:hypothetical protein